MTTFRIAAYFWPFVFVPLIAQSRAATASAVKPNAQQIEAELGKCLAEGGANDFQSLECYQSAYEKMDQRMNEVYRALMTRLSPRQKAALQDAQRKWLRFRDAEEKFSDSLNSGDEIEEGTLDRVLGAEKSYDLLKRRTEELEGYLRSTVLP